MLYVDNKKCTGCGTCTSVCPQGAISIHKNVAVISEMLCNECGNCAVNCPTEAIHIKVPVYAQSVKGDDEMRGRGWFRGGHRGWGTGNPYPFCRFYPWLPRRWRAYRAGYYPMGYHPAPGYYPQTTPAYYRTYAPNRW